MNPIYRFQWDIEQTNVFDPRDVQHGYQVNALTGAIVPNPNMQVSGFFRVKESSTYYLRKKSDFGSVWVNNIAYYDKYKTRIAGQSGSSAFNVPAGAVWARFSVSDSLALSVYGVFLSTVSVWADYLSTDANPVWPDGLTKDYEKESGQVFFREKLNGKLTFQRDDYDYITTQPFDTDFKMLISISYDNGSTWADYLQCHFWKTDCEFDLDAETVTVSPSTTDDYSEVLDGLEKEFDIIKLAPAMTSVKYDQRPLLQIYVADSEKLTNIVGQTYWEQDCEACDFETARDSYGFRPNKGMRVARISGSFSPSLPSFFYGITASVGAYTLTGTQYTFQVLLESVDHARFIIYANSDPSNILWRRIGVPIPDGGFVYPMSVTLGAVSGSGASGNVEVYIYDIRVMARILCNVDSIGGNPTWDIPLNDMAGENANYKKGIGAYLDASSIAFYDVTTATPTEWGVAPNNEYYEQKPPVLGASDTIPIGRSSWQELSVWFQWMPSDNLWEAEGRNQLTMKDAYAISDVISVLLAQFSSCTHQGTTAYSQFLYGTPIIKNASWTLIVTPKSNIVKGNYDQPAQKAPVTLKQVFDMLRDCFQCYWFVDKGKLRIEHIDYFRRGGQYSGSPSVGIDLTTMVSPRTGKAWATGVDKYSFEKPTMPARYQFGWMDDVSFKFKGEPLNIVSGYVQKNNTEEVTVANFTSDIDFIVADPSNISLDGFVLFGAQLVNGEYVLPYVTDTDNFVLQNGYMSFEFLQQYYLWNLPASKYKIGDGAEQNARAVVRNREQTLKFPMLNDPANLRQLVKTNLGNGEFAKISINLSSRIANVTLKYDTE